MARQLFLSRLALFATFFALGVIGLGALTRLLDAGLGCPDWPGCFGHLVAPTTDAVPGVIAYKAWAEMIHRYFVGGLSLLILTIIGTILSSRSLRTRGNVAFVAVLIALLSYQIMLGRWTVTLKLLPIIVTQHLLGGFLILSTVWLVHLANKPATAFVIAPVNKPILMGALGALLLLFMQILLGAWTSTNYASFSCPDFPMCFSDQAMQWQVKEAFQLFPAIGINYDGGVLPEAVRQTIQMIHRVGALIVAAYLVLFMAVVAPRLKNKPSQMRQLYIMMALLSIQLCVGISNVIFKLPLVTAVSHNLMASLLLLALITLVYKLLHAREGE